MIDKHTVDLTGEQIACLQESLRYSEQAIRDYDYGPLDQAADYRLRNDKLAMLASTRQALKAGEG